jgi:hypothetical protein
MYTTEDARRENAEWLDECNAARREELLDHLNHATREELLARYLRSL